MAESAASAPPPRPGPPLIPPPRASSIPAAGFEAALGAAGAGPFSAADSYDDAEPALSAVSADALPPASDEEGPPLAELEAQMRGEIIARDATGVASPSARRAAASVAEDDDADGKATALPDIDALVARLPAEVRETLDELFRARFVSVKKLPKKLLQPASSRRGGDSPDKA